MDRRTREVVAGQQSDHIRIEAASPGQDEVEGGRLGAEVVKQFRSAHADGSRTASAQLAEFFLQSPILK
jgi:hypothetical protein